MVEGKCNIRFGVWSFVQESPEAKLFPSVAQMACNYLGVVATSATAEWLFSSGMDLVSWRRHVLHSDTIRACMCLSNWWGD